MQALLLLSEEGGRNLTWLLWVVLILFLLIVLIGWWVSRNKGEQDEIQADVPAAQKTADDLTVLEGVGPKVAKILTEAGYASFADLAKADHVEVVVCLQHRDVHMVGVAGDLCGLAADPARQVDGVAAAAYEHVPLLGVEAPAVEARDLLVVVDVGGVDVVWLAQCAVAHLGREAFGHQATTHRPRHPRHVVRRDQLQKGLLPVVRQVHGVAE